MMVDQQPFPRSVDAAPIGIDWEDNEDDQELGVLFLEAEEEDQMMNDRHRSDTLSTHCLS